MAVKKKSKKATKSAKSAPSKKKAAKKSPASKAAKKKTAPKKKSAPKAKAKVSSKKKPAVKKTAPKKKAVKPAKKASPKKAKKVKVSSAPAATSTVAYGRKPLFPIRRPESVQFRAKKQAKKAPARFNKKFLDAQLKKLVDLRDHILDQMQGVTQENLRSKEGQSASSAFGMHQADAGSEAYEKDFALSLLSQEQDALYEIEEAIKRIEHGSYGICEMSGNPIPNARLEAIPFARYTVECQAQFERENRGRNRWDTNPQFMESADNFFEEDDDNSDDDSTRNKE